MAHDAGPPFPSPLIDPGVRVLRPGLVELNHERQALGPGTPFEVHEQIFSILTEYLRPDNQECSIYGTAKRIANLIPPLEGEDEEYVWAEQAMYLAMYMFELAQQIPHHHPSQDRLVRLLRYLGTCNKMMIEAGYGEGVGKLWNDRTIFLNAWREWKKNGRDSIGFGPNYDPKKKINGHGFMARLMGAGHWMGDISNVVYSFRDYFEEPTTLDDDDDDHNDAAGHEATVISCMSMWVIYGGQQLFDRVVLNRYRAEDDPNPNSYKPGELFDGPDLRLGRWRFWQHRFATVKPNDVNAEAIDLATRASNLMLAIESAMTF